MFNMKIGRVHIGIIYMLSIFSYGLVDLTSGVQVYRVLSVLIFIFIVVWTFDKREILIPPKSYVVIISFLIFTSLVSYNSFGYHQATAYLNILLLIYVSVFCIRTAGHEKIISLYMFFCYLFSLVAIFQEFIHIVGLDVSFFKTFIKVENITNSGPFLRVFSLTGEPSHLALLLMPAVFMLIAQFLSSEEIVKVKRRYKITISSAYILTFSTLAYSYLAIFLVVFLLVKLKNAKVYFLVCTMVPALVIMSTTESVSERLETIQYVFDVDDNVNSSVFAIQSNLQVTKSVLSNSPFLGNGIFTHMDSYLNKIGDIYYIDNNFRLLNIRDGSSIYLRLLSEVGVVGLMLYWLFIVFSIYKYRNNYVYLSLVAALICFGLRNGNYDTPMLWFIMTLFILNDGNFKNTGSIE